MFFSLVTQLQPLRSFFYVEEKNKTDLEAFVDDLISHPRKNRILTGESMISAEGVCECVCRILHKYEVNAREPSLSREYNFVISNI